MRPPSKPAFTRALKRTLLRAIVLGWLLVQSPLGVARTALPTPVLSIVPAAMPDPQIRGFHFPENEATLTRWITEMNRNVSTETADAAAARIYLHGWGLWTALTSETAQIYEGQRLRVFETWLTPDDLTLQSETTLPMPSRRRSPLQPLAQLHLRMAEAAAGEPAGDPQISRVVGFVKFDPTAADHIQKQDLLHLSTLETLLQGGAQQIPPFPSTSLAVKPIFQIVRARDLVEDRYYLLKAWSGPPAVPQAWSPTQWEGAVWIDVLGGGSGSGEIDTIAAADGSSRMEGTTYPLSSLIHYRLSSADAEALNLAKPGSDATGGDYAILVAMHVSGREIARWTWQTFWWTPSPENPGLPSTPTMASIRPSQLVGPARNYAMALAYTLLSPDQPYVGGENAGPAVYAYNPWVEARFGPADLPDSKPGLDPNGRPATNNYGVQTNCMSCHAQATYNPCLLPTAPRFTGARYVDLGAAEFVGTLQVDFLWSLPRHAK